MQSEGKPASFLRHAMTYGIGALATPLAGFVVVPIYTHYLDPAEYGALQLMYRIGSVFHICLMIGGIRLAAFYLYGTHDDHRSRHHAAASITTFTVFVLIAGALLTVSLGSWLNEIIAFGNSELLVWGVLTLMVRSLSVMPLALMQARFESTAFVVYSLAIAATHVVLVAIAVAVMGWGVWGVLAALAVTHASFGLGLTLREFARATWRPDWKQMVEIARFALPFVPAGIFFFVMHNGDHFLLMKYSGAATLGVYALGYQFVQMLETMAIGPLNQVWHPWIYRAGKQANGPVALGQAATRIIGVYVFLAAGLIMFRHEVLFLMGTPAYAGAAAVMPALAIAYFFLAASDLVDASFYITNKTYLKPVVAAFSAVAFSVFYLLLIPPYGAMGAAYATLAGFVCHLVFSGVAAQRAYTIAYEPRRLITMLGTAIVLAVSADAMGMGPAPFVLKCAMWLAWPAALWFAGFFSEEERRYVTSGVSRVLRWLERFRGGGIANESSP